jgi:amino acid adenylation domain-containing protein
MSRHRSLHEYFCDAARLHAAQLAVVEPGRGSVTYGELEALSGQVRDRLSAMRVQPGHRVGIYLRKSVDSLATMLGILRAGGAYVPVDPGAPVERNAYILSNCAVTAVIVDAAVAARLSAEFSRSGFMPALLEVDGPGGGNGLRSALQREDEVADVRPQTDAARTGEDLAYILYTSGSTGKPKGVMLSHENAVTFVDWCSEVFEPRNDDRFSSHAPFHFDLSILDIHVCLKHGATLVLIDEGVGKDPSQLAALIDEEKISIWYSAPSILSLLAQFGALETRDYSRLRHVLFAGEVFPVKHLRTLCALVPGKRYFNLYGPTETNVCTYYEVMPPVPEDRSVPYPIGKTCSHLRSKVVEEDGREVACGEEGELCIAGPGVMQGYWGLPEQTEKGFLPDRDGTRWYRTGDIVVEAPDGNYTYRGRRDRMVKRRGYRVELGEIESGIYRHAQVKEVAVIALPNEEGVSITAFVSAHEGKRPSLIEMKRFCSENLPLYMIPDRFVWLQALPKTSTDKIDYQTLKAMV